MQFFRADATLFLNNQFFFAHEKLKKPSPKVAYFSICWAVSVLPKTALSAQTDKVQGSLELFGALCMYICGLTIY